MYKKSVWEHKKTLAKLQSEVRERHIQNQHLDQQVLDCQVSVAEQQQVEDLAGKVEVHWISPENIITTNV